MSMTPRQRWLAVLTGQQPDRIPTDFWSTWEVQQRLMKELACPDHESLWRKLHIDRLRGVGPKYKGTAEAGADMWGIRYQNIDYGTGTYSEAVHHPLANAAAPADIHKHRWPSPDDFDFAPVKEFFAKDDGYRPIQGGGYEPFLLYCSLRGMEQAYEDLLLCPDIADAILGHIFEFHYELNRRTYQAAKEAGGTIDLTYVAEDLGSQTGPLMGLETYRRFLRENQRKMADLARSFGIHVFYHTDGAARVFLPDLVDYVGIEVLNPIQWRCPGMDREGLIRDYGKKIGFHGGIDNQQTLPFGSVKDVTDEVKDSVRIFKGARWICAPCHNIQPVTPTANIVAMYQTIHEFGSL